MVLGCRVLGLGFRVYGVDLKYIYIYIHIYVYIYVFIYLSLSLGCGVWGLGFRVLYRISDTM